MDTATDHQHPTRAASERRLDPVVTMLQLATHLGVSVQTLYDLRSHGGGPRGFWVGSELRFRVREVDAWLTDLEEADDQRHSGGVG